MKRIRVRDVLRVSFLAVKAALFLSIALFLLLNLNSCSSGDSGDSSPGPDIGLSSTSLNFGDVVVEDSASSIITVTSNGTENLTISNVSLEGSDAGNFSQTNDCSTVSPGDSCEITVTFTPSSTGSKSASLSVQSSDPDESTVDVSCGGNGNLLVQTLKSPVRIAFSADGNLLVSDYVQQKILTLDRSSLEIIQVLSEPGRPVAVASANGDIYVGDESTGSVKVYSSAGQLLYYLGDGAGFVTQPSDIAIDTSQNLVFVVDGNDKTIKVFNTSGPLQYTIGGSGSDPALLVNPTGIAIDEDSQEVFVSDYGNPVAGIPARVKIYDYSSNYLGGISGEAVSGYEFSRPQGLTVDENHIFLVDSLLGQVLVFDRITFEGVTTLGSFGSDPGQLFLPLDIIINNSSKDVFVTNNRPMRVEVFREGGQIP